MAGLFGSTTPPDVIAPPPIPDSQSPAVIEAARQAATDAAARSGRSSTILTGDASAPAANRGGTDSYASTKLGSAG